MFFRKKIFYPLAYDMADHISPMLSREFDAWYKKDEQAFLNLVSFFYFLKSNVKLFKKCKKEDLSYYLLTGFKNTTSEVKKIIDDLSEELCSKKLSRDMHYYIEELNTINGY